MSGSSVIGGGTSVLVGGVPSYSLPPGDVYFTKLNVASSTFTDDIPSTTTSFIYPAVVLGTIQYGAELVSTVYGSSVFVTAATLATTLKTIVLFRDSTIQPTVTHAQFVGAANNAFLNMTPGGGGLTTGQSAFGGGTNGNQFISIGGGSTDSYGNTIATGDTIVLDFGFFFNQLKVNQTATCSMQIQYGYVLL